MTAVDPVEAAESAAVIHNLSTAASDMDPALLAEKVAEYNLRVETAARLLPFPHPIAQVRWVHIDQVQANDYNPNSVARNEMRLLHTSIAQDGYTQPVVTIWDDEIGKYVIVDGFHRYTVMRTQADIQATTGGYLPIVVIDKSIADRIAATVRHNRARGKHSVAGMSNLVFQMLREGVPDEQICQQIGLEPEELLRLKHITGFSKLFADHTYGKAWETPRQLVIKADWARAHPDELPTI
jgi:ParB-like chromosome segregation protein Spo0J